MELNQIPQNPNNWGNVADLLNENSGKIEAETAKLNNATTKFKGYFSTSTALSAKWPSPIVGDTAWVGATYPGVVYRCNVPGEWLATTDVPPSNTVNLSEYATQDAVSNEFASVRSDLNGLNLTGSITANEYKYIGYTIPSGRTISNKSSIHLYICADASSANRVFVSSGASITLEFDVTHLFSSTSVDYNLEVENIVLLSETQILSDKKKRISRNNIGAVSDEDVEMEIRKNIASKNMVAADTLVSGYITTNGTIITSSAYYTSEFIRLNHGDIITISPQCLKIAEYNLDKTFISGTYQSDLGNNYTHTQVNDGYVRVTFMVSLGKYQIERGSIATSYTPYKLSLNDVLLGTKSTEQVRDITSDEVEFLTAQSDVETETLNVFGDISWESGRYLNDGTFDSNSYYKNTKLSATGGDSFTFISTLNILLATFWRNGAFIGSGGGSDKTVRVPANTDTIIVSFAASGSITGCTKTTFKRINNATESTFSTNYLNLTTATFDKLIKIDGTMIDGDSGCLVTDFIPVKAGEHLIIGDGFNISRYFRFVTAYNSAKIVVIEAGQEMAYGYNVPAGISYVRCSLSAPTVYADTRINKSNRLLNYEQYSYDVLPKGTMDRRMIEYDLKYRPLTSLGLIKPLAYRPLGTLSKAYFCLISDDGYEGVCTYSIPNIVIAKNVPMTFGIMKGSPCLQDTYLPTLVDAIQNHGCTIAQHGFTEFTKFTEDQLNAFFDSEKDYFDELGLELKGAICPAHTINEMVAAVCGQRFGVLRTGYHGNGNDVKGYMPNQYGWYMNSTKSNVYALDCYGIAVEPLQDHYAHIDYAKTHNMLIIGFFHEWGLDNQGGTQPHMQVEAIVDYALQQGLEFVTLDQIPELI